LRAIDACRTGQACVTIYTSVVASASALIAAKQVRAVSVFARIAQTFVCVIESYVIAEFGITQIS